MRWLRAHPRALFAVVVGALASTIALWLFSPVPSALLIRALFHYNAQQTLAEMAPFAPKSGLTADLDVAYAPGGRDTTLDVFRPTAAAEPLPLVVWIHGGAWVSGSKENIRPYVQLLAEQGYVAVAVNYTVAPEAQYPTAVRQLNSALEFLLSNADRFGIDPTRVVLAGDSAGANLGSQLAAMATNPAFAKAAGIRPSITAEQLRAVVLNCGIYDVSRIPEATGLVGWGFNEALWAYLGIRNYAGTADAEEMSTINSVTGDFPTTWISGGNADPLTASQSVPLSAKLQELGVAVTEVFYPATTTPPLGHEYQFHLTLADAQSALQSTINFLAGVTR